MFVLMGKFTDLSQIMKSFPADNSQDLFDQTYAIGVDIGTLIRVSVGYKLGEPLKKKHF